MLNIKDLRKEYDFKCLNLEDLDLDPFKQLALWIQEASDCQIFEPNAMILATADAKGFPSSRTILLKKIDRGLVFFTNTESRKAKELHQNPVASVTFFWRELQRQAHAEGDIEKLSDEEAAAYFATRPRGSQISAWASHQDQIIQSRKILQDAVHDIEQEFQGKEIPIPPYWGGYRLHPKRFEFWQGRPNRLHDRFQYSLIRQAWEIVRLSP